jgi:uncharacterized protein
MKSKNVLLLGFVIILLVTIFYGFNQSQNDPAYIEQIASDRYEKDQYMRTADDSPFAKSKSEFTGLKYFEPDLNYRIVASLEYVEGRKVILLPTSDGKEQRYMDYAYAEFNLDGVSNRLLILEVMDLGPFRGKLFLAFGDETSGKETYGAGRYLDIDKVPGANTITLDFNNAYNPYCAYDNSFSCPLPPRENLLKVAIKAGEKIYH